MAKISKKEAYDLAIKIGADFDKDIYAQKAGVVRDIADISKLAGYRKPKYASGSTGRYFFEHLERLKKKRRW